METRHRRGRNAQGQNGPSSTGTGRARKPANGDPSGAKPKYDELGPKPQGRVSSEKGIIRNHTDLCICTYNVRTLRSEEDRRQKTEDRRNRECEVAYYRARRNKKTTKS